MRSDVFAIGTWRPGRQARTIVDVVDSFELEALPGIDPLRMTLSARSSQVLLLPIDVAGIRLPSLIPATSTTAVSSSCRGSRTRRTGGEPCDRCMSHSVPSPELMSRGLLDWYGRRVSTALVASARRRALGEAGTRRSTRRFYLAAAGRLGDALASAIGTSFGGAVYGSGRPALTLVHVTR